MTGPAGDNVELHRTLSEDLADLERTDPEVRRGALAVDVATSRVLGCRHLLPCKPGRCSGIYTDVHQERERLAYIRKTLVQLRTDQPDTCWRPAPDWENVCILALGHGGPCGWESRPTEVIERGLARLPKCDAIDCPNPADWAFIGKGADLYLCILHGGSEPVEGWTWIGE